MNNFQAGLYRIKLFSECKLTKTAVPCFDYRIPLCFVTNNFKHLCLKRKDEVPYSYILSFFKTFRDSKELFMKTIMEKLNV